MKHEGEEERRVMIYKKLLELPMLRTYKVIGDIDEYNDHRLHNKHKVF